MATDPNSLPLNEMGDEDPQAFYKRLVVERCLYGVDVNPLAVELAKLSLWLHTVSRDKALSFLDHHLRCGNSLIGARVEDDLMKEPPQFNARGRRTNAESQQLVLGFTEAFTATHLHYFLDTFRQIVETPSGDTEMERRKDELYRAMDTVRDKFRAVANCWLAPFFGVPVTPQQYECAMNALRGADSERHMLAQEIWFLNAQAITQAKRFFHWELEFPEVFFDAHGLKPKAERGFDAVIGNPPYVGFHGMEGQKPYLRITYTSCSGKFDIYVAFLERSLLLLKERHRLCFICPSTFMKRDFAKQFRVVFRDHWTLERLVDFGSEQIFADVTNYTCIPVIANQLPSEEYEFEFSYSELNHDRMKLPSTLLSHESWILTDAKSLNALNKILDKNMIVTLHSVVETISEGIVTGCNDVFIVDEAAIEKFGLEHTFIKRCLSGEHIHRFECSWANDYLI